MILMIKDLLKCLYSLFVLSDLFCVRMKIQNKGGKYRFFKNIMGHNNYLQIGRSAVLNRISIKLRGNDNTIMIGENVKMGNNCEFYIEGNNISIIIGNNCTFTHDVQLLAQEDDSQITIGEDCMFSHHIYVRTSDSHPIYDIKSGLRINNASSVNIGNHVWITPFSIIQKGVHIGDNVVVATNSIVTKDIPHNTIAGGMPAKIIKENITWKRVFASC